MSQFHLSDSCMLGFFDFSPHPLPPCSSPPLSLMDSPLPPVLTRSLLLRCNVSPGVGNAEKWFASVRMRLSVKSCLCVCVPTTFNVMLIQFIFNEETVSAYRKAKEISGLLHSGKSIARLFIWLFELCV